jgi:hypothetical protein
MSLETALLALGLEKVNEDSVIIANNSIPSKLNVNYYASSDHTEFVLIEKIDDVSVLSNRWKDVQAAIGMYSGIQNADMGKYYLKLEEPDLVSLNATFRNDQYIFNIKQVLSFTNTDTEKWTVSEIDDH